MNGFLSASPGRLMVRLPLVAVCAVALVFFFATPASTVVIDSSSEVLPENDFSVHQDLLSLLQTDPTEELLTLAEIQLARGAWQEAKEYLNAVLVRKEGHQQARGLLGVLAALGGSSDEAAKQLEMLGDHQAQEVNRQLIRAILAAQRQDFSRAQTSLDAVLQQQPENLIGLYYQGSLLLAQEKLPQAEVFLGRVRDAYPNFPPAAAGLAQVYRGQCNAAKAIDLLRQAVTLDPDNILYRRQLVELYRQAGNQEAANQETITMVYYAPGVKQATIEQGMKLLAVGAYDAAIERMAKALQVYGHIPEAHYITAAALINQGGSEKRALDHLDTFLAGRKGLPLSHHYAGIAYLSLQQLDQAEIQFKKAISLNPRLGRSFIPLVIIEQVKGNYDVALGGLALARRWGEPAPLVDYLTAHVLLARGDTEGFQVAIKGAAALLPKIQETAAFILPAKKDREAFCRARNLLALLFYNGWYGSAGEVASSLIHKNRDDRFAWYFTLLVSETTNQHARGMSAARELVRIDPLTPAWWQQLGLLARQEGNLQEAENAYKKVVELDPASEPARTELSKITLERQRKE
ncbi:MAG: tetratricopeptide repeat protein [Deltaproteobacteria bacterium]|nr:tetratricopeptide repeat protein [Candidatus Anaeroferrophillus wilburensis]MBN2888905.1 tetratricopeptide repeat protein [Deltaproteobacteria bacterium]